MMLLFINKLILDLDEHCYSKNNIEHYIFPCFMFNMYKYIFIDSFIALPGSIFNFVVESIEQNNTRMRDEFIFLSFFI